LIIYFSTATAQNIYCDSLSVNEVTINTNLEKLVVTIANISDTLIVYPEFMAVIDSNPYLMTDPAVITATFLDRSTGINGGLTDFKIPLDSFTAAAAVPLNTVFTGNATFQHPTDQYFTCSWNFTFTYGTENSSSISPIAAKNFLSVFPNPADQWALISDQLIVKENMEMKVFNTMGEEIYSAVISTAPYILPTVDWTPGVYFVHTDFRVAKLLIVH